MQMISGMNIASYWISNYIFDILKAEIPMVIVIGFTYAFSLDVSYLCLLMIFILVRKCLDSIPNVPHWSGSIHICNIIHLLK